MDNNQVLILPIHVFKSIQLSSNEKLILSYIGYKSQYSKNYVRCAYSALVDNCAISRPTAIRSIQSIIAKGYLDKEIRRKPKDAPTMANGYERYGAFYRLTDKFFLPETEKE